VGRVDLAGLVLAAGLGTRIAALSRFRPKPLLPLGLDTPFSRAVDALRRGGAFRLAANASHLAEQLVAAGRAIDVEVVVEENGPLGTAGGLAATRDRLKADHVAIWNGDIVADIDVGDLRSAIDSTGAVAALSIRATANAGEGNVGLDEEQRVVRLRDRSFGREAQGAWFAAVHVLHSSLVERAPARGCLIADVYLPALAEGAKIVAVPSEGRWHDIGDVAGYLAANLDELDLAPSLVAPTGIVSDRARLDGVVVGEDARIDGVGDVVDVVVWPGARAEAPLRRAIVVDAEHVVRA